MSGQRLGYVRVSTLDQNTVRQLDGIPVDKTYVERGEGGSVVARPGRR
jgi:DNA invertase Pin-like site-specific DNA recombinase